jgi:hypothetical protein
MESMLRKREIGMIYTGVELDSINCWDILEPDQVHIETRVKMDLP